MKGPEATQFCEALSTELFRLLRDTKTVEWIHPTQKPADRRASYFNPQVKVKINQAGERVYRVRGTYGGNISDYTGDTYAGTADLQTFKLLCNATVSESAYLLTGDISDFYLMNDLERPEYMWLERAHVPADVQAAYANQIIWRDNRAMVQVNKGIYGLPQAGRLAQEKLVTLLAKHDYLQCENTPLLFRQKASNLTFCLVVGDFAIKYHSRADAEDLISAIRKEYKFEVDWEASSYLAMTVKHVQGVSIDLSMPGYVASAMQRFGITKNLKPTHAPLPYSAPTYGPSSQLVSNDSSPAASPKEAKFLQEVIGTFLWYARTVDNTMLCPFGKLASRQAKPTASLVRAIHHFLQYAACHPDAVIRILPSDMRLIISSDASYLSESQARSRAAGYHFLGFNGDPLTSRLNAAVDIVSTIITSVASSAAEAEVGAFFVNAQAAAATCATLADLGYPQTATPIITDNSTADGYANRTTRVKRAKSMDMRYQWVRCRTASGAISVIWAPGSTNIADYFTKIHPAVHYKAMRRIFLHKLVC